MFRCPQAIGALGFLLSCGAAISEGQVVQGPPDSIRPLLGGSLVSKNSLSLTVDVDGGYDDNATPEPTTPVSSLEDVATIESGYAATMSTLLRYRRGRTATRFVQGTGNAVVDYQQIGTDLAVSRVFRSDVAGQMATPFNDRSGMTADAGIAYEPTSLYSALGSADSSSGGGTEYLDGVSPPATNASAAVTRQVWLAARGSGSLYYKWTSRQRIEGRYETTRRSPQRGIGLTSRSQTATLTQSWNRSTISGLDALYRFEDNPQAFENSQAREFRSHALEARLRFGRALSPRRRITFVTGGGAVRTTAESLVGNTPIEFWGPVAIASARFEFRERWALSATARRDVSVLDGLTPEPFASTATSLALDGVFARRVLLSASADYSTGASRITDNGDFSMLLGNVQLRYGLSSTIGLLVRYTYSDHSVDNVAVVPVSFPNHFTSSSIRVGFTMWLPLYGAF